MKSLYQLALEACIELKINNSIQINKLPKNIRSIINLTLFNLNVPTINWRNDAELIVNFLGFRDRPDEDSKWLNGTKYESFHLSEPHCIVSKPTKIDTIKSFIRLSGSHIFTPKKLHKFIRNYECNAGGEEEYKGYIVCDVFDKFNNINLCYIDYYAAYGHWNNVTIQIHPCFYKYQYRSVDAIIINGITSFVDPIYNLFYWEI